MIRIGPEIQKHFKDQNITVKTLGRFPRSPLGLECDLCGATWTERFLAEKKPMCPECEGVVKKSKKSNKKFASVNKEK